MTATVLKRLRAMDGAELKHRATTALRTRMERARSTIRKPEWRRDALRLLNTTQLDAARAALSRQDWQTAHQLLARYFRSRDSVFPLDPRRLGALASTVRARFGDSDARARAENVLQGRYDLLGYRSVLSASPPDWHRDPVHHRSVPLIFWDAVPYLDPACGDHKITWELNRHQHFLALGRAYALTQDRRLYAAFVDHLTDWIDRNPPLMGTNWASMLELAFRCLSWTWGIHFFAGAAADDDREPWIVDLLMALDRQLAHVEENLSRYFSPNTHLTGEALALYVAGRALPELERSARRAAVGRRILLEEAARQVLADGGHAERSTHYHRYSTDFYLFALNVARCSRDPQAEEFREPALRQAQFLRAIADDRGCIPLIGDDDGGQLFPIGGRPPTDCADTLATAAVLLNDPSLAVGPLPEETYWLCGSAGDLEHFEFAPHTHGSIALSASGYCVSRNSRGDHLVFDCGAHGYLNGGHAHADALAVTLTVGGRPLLVDPGTATYTMDAAVRDRFRSTAMHNTVVIDGRSQSLPAGPFHWRTRTDARCTKWRPADGGDVAAGCHTGYAPFVHTREIVARHGVGWSILDRVEGAGSVRATAMWHFHPAWSLESLDGNHALLRHADGARMSFLASVPLRQPEDLALHEWAPEYGRRERCLCLEAAVDGAAPLSLAAFIPADGMLETAHRLASSVLRA
jgi:hypothetical protein